MANTTAGENLDDVDLDSALGDDTASDTSTLASSILRHREEFGRTYHKFRADEAQYWGPNDEQQNNQLDIGHHMLTLLLDNKLYVAPIPEECHKVIDLGCGTGLWAIDFADAQVSPVLIKPVPHPEAEVIGVDLSPIQPNWVPPNCKFIVDDIADRWVYEDNYFDFVHLRCLFGSIADWKALYRQIYQKTKPGGWIQQLEMSIVFTSDDGTVDENSFMAEWARTFIEFGEKSGRTMRIADLCGDLIREAGFENIEETWYKVPIGPWPKDNRLKEIGLYSYHYCNEGCEGWALYALVKVFGWSIEQAHVYVAKFRNELKNRKNHAYYKVVVVSARKPLKSHG